MPSLRSSKNSNRENDQRKCQEAVKATRIEKYTNAWWWCWYWQTRIEHQEAEDQDQSIRYHWWYLEPKLAMLLIKLIEMQHIKFLL